MRRLLVFLVLPFFLFGCSTKPQCSNYPNEKCTRILFIGNSYTYVNDLPGLFAELAKSGKHLVETQTLAQAGLTLADHVNDENTPQTIQSVKWDYVVLQEQSEIPAIEQSRTTGMYPAVRVLLQWILGNSEQPLFFLTWAHRDGDAQYGFADYDSMQNQIVVGYLKIAREQGVPVVPVGYAWWTARKQYPDIDLWQADGSHPNNNGTYLAACVFYASIFRESPEGLAFTAQVSATTAQELQSIAARVVLDDPEQWGF